MYAVGGPTLACVLPQIGYRGAGAAGGLAGGNKLETTVIPFLLRGVRLLGIDSVLSPPAERREAWARLARDLPMEKLDAMVQEATLAELLPLGRDILQGRVRGRVRSEEHTSELQSLMRNSYAALCL